jgi:hypothetical protein
MLSELDDCITLRNVHIYREMAPENPRLGGGGLCRRGQFDRRSISSSGVTRGGNPKQSQVSPPNDLYWIGSSLTQEVVSESKYL